jgi:hypothetical protein
VNSEQKRPNEFRRHRQVLASIYIATATAIFLLLTASVARELFFRSPSVNLPKSSIVAENPAPQDLLECHNLVLEQLTSLNNKTHQLLNHPLHSNDEGRAVSEAQKAWQSDWNNFSTEWRDQWDVVDARCRFTELAKTDQGRAYEQIAQVHEALPAMRLKFNRLLADFDKTQAAELLTMRRALAESRKSILREIGKSLPKASPAEGSP